MTPFLAAVCSLCLATLLASAGVCLYRVSIGPHTPDRAVAFDTLVMVFVSIVCTLCIRWGSSLYFDSVWILTLVGFLGTASIARFLERGRLF